MHAGPPSPAAPLARFPPPAARSRAPEFYGFVAWTATYLLFALLLLWALLPDAALAALGVAWYPSREWALLVPAYTVVLVLLTYAAYLALALSDTPALSDARTLTDDRAHWPADARAYAAAAEADASPLLYDVPLGLANRVLYARRAAAAAR